MLGVRRCGGTTRPRVFEWRLSLESERSVDLRERERPVGLIGGHDDCRRQLDLTEQVGVLELDVKRIHLPQPPGMDTHGARVVNANVPAV